MGYEVTTGRIIRVRLRNTEFDGAECRAESTSVDEYLAVRGKGDEILLEAFSAKLLDWNLLQNSEPLPATSEALATIDSSLALSLAIGWLTGITKVEADRPFVQQTQTEPPASNGAVEMEVL